MFEKDDTEAHTVKYIFLSLDFEYNQSGKPNGFKYEAAKDSIRWMGLSPKDYIPLIRRMFNNYMNNIAKV